MANPSHYLIPNPEGTAFTGTGYTPDGTFPPNAIPCTAEHVRSFQSLAPDMSTTPVSIGYGPDPALLIPSRIARILELTSEYNSSISSVPVIIRNTEYVLDNHPERSLANGGVAISMHIAIAGAQSWEATSEVLKESYINHKGSYLVCSREGVTGNTPPEPPTGFGVSVIDGTAQWELLGRYLWLIGGEAILVTPKEFLSAVAQADTYIHAQTHKLIGLMARVNSCGTSSLQAITW